MPVHYCFDTEVVDDFSDLCRRYSGNALQSPYRSTVPLLSLVEHNRSEWLGILGSLGAPPDARVHFEFCVASPKVGGNPSQTDVLLTSDLMVWAIEAKWTEPRYETIAKRLAKLEADGADPRLTVSGWLMHLQEFANRQLRLEDFGGVVYQMLHRAASACVVAKKQSKEPRLVYFHFSPSPDMRSSSTDQYLADLKLLHGLMGSPIRMGFIVVEIPMQPTSAFEAIKSLNKRSPASSIAVVEALRRGPLFEFLKPKIMRI
jgi:hypothetical protein